MVGVQDKTTMETKKKAGRPKLPPGVKRPRFVTHVSPDTSRKVSQKAAALGVPLGHVIDMMAKACLPDA
jgi:hypothetical protein